MSINPFSQRPAGLLMALIVAVGMVPIYRGAARVDSAPNNPLQTLPMHPISLQTKQAFQTSGPNWSIAGGVRSNRLKSNDLHPLSGSVILVNTPTGAHHDPLVTRMHHGDLELELDFLMPKGSNSGIYLQGRYEVQLLDSWGVENPHFGDCGGIYQRWDPSKPEGHRGYGGHAPAMNASRAPGLWQHLKIIFTAPAFDDQGHKTANAMFQKVWLNGVLVQKQVAVTGPTRAALFTDEKPTGPLVIQGDHGPVAIRHIRYKKYDKNHMSLRNLHYDFYSGAFKKIPDWDTLHANASGHVDSLVGDLGKDAERYLLHYIGTLDVPNTGTYLFKMQQAGMSRLSIDGRPVIDQTHFYTMDQYDSGTITLTKGEHAVDLMYIDHPRSWLHGLALYGEGPQLRMQPFHAAQSVPGGGKKIPPLIVKAKKRVKTIRSFGMFGDIKRTDVMNVGSPGGINYNYDIGQGELLHIWDGAFVDTSPMWRGRGSSQTAIPLGSVIKLDGRPPLARLANRSQPWPDSIAWGDMHIQGYDLRDNGWPEFRYKIGNLSIQDYLSGTVNKRKIIRKIQLESLKKEQGLWLHLASGDTIRKNANGEYVIDDRSYYLKVLNSGGAKPVIRNTEGGQELLVPVLSTATKTTLRYAFIW